MIAVGLVTGLQFTPAAIYRVISIRFTYRPYKTIQETGLNRFSAKRRDVQYEHGGECRALGVGRDHDGASLMG